MQVMTHGTEAHGATTEVRKMEQFKTALENLAKHFSLTVQMIILMFQIQIR